MKLIPGPAHRPGCFVLHCGRHDKRVVQRVAHNARLTARGSLHIRLPADQTPHRLDAIRERCLIDRCSNCRCSNYLGAWSPAWRKRPAWKHGHWEHLMLLMKPPTAQGGNALKFSTPGTLPKWAIDFPHCAKELHPSISPGSEAPFKSAQALHPHISIR